MRVFAAFLVFVILLSAAFTTFQMNQTQEIDLSSMASANLYSYELDAYSARFTDQMVQEELTQIDSQWKLESRNESTRQAYVYTPEQIALDESNLASAQEISAAEERCESIYPVENNKMYYNEMKSRIEAANLEARIKQLGFKEVNIANLTEALALAAYNAGVNPPFNALQSFVEKREKAGLRISARDFDFYATATATDIDGKEKDVLSIAREFVIAPFISPITAEGKALQVKRTKILKQKIDNSFKLTFPEHMIYQQTNLNEIGGKINAKFRVLGLPGYLNFLAKKNMQIREFFVKNGKGADFCAKADYLRMSR